MMRQSETLAEQENKISELKQQVIILEDQVDTSREDAQKLESSLSAYKQKYSQSMNDIGQLEESVKTLQERLTESRNKELEKEQRIESLKNDYENMDRMYNETKHEVQKCEDVVDQLTQELNASQEELSLSQNRVRECEENIKNLKDRISDLTAEVRRRPQLVTCLIGQGGGGGINYNKEVKVNWSSNWLSLQYLNMFKVHLPLCPENLFQYFCTFTYIMCLFFSPCPMTSERGLLRMSS